MVIKHHLSPEFQIPITSSEGKKNLTLALKNIITQFKKALKVTKMFEYCVYMGKPNEVCIPVKITCILRIYQTGPLKKFIRKQNPYIKIVLLWLLFRSSLRANYIAICIAFPKHQLIITHCCFVQYL